MGISNDIRPKQSRSHNHHHKMDDFEIPIEIEDSDFKAHETKIEKLEDDFFRPEEKDRRKVQKVESGKHFPYKSLIWLMVIALITVTVYQNWGIIKSNAINQYDSLSGNKTEKNEDYVSESVNEENLTQTSNNTSNDTSTVTPPAESTTTTLPSAPAIDKSIIKMRILNGNGINKSAEKIKEQLITAGFTVSKVSNASSFSYQSSIIYYHTGKEAEAELVKDSLPTLEITLENSDKITGSYDIVVLVGKK